MAAGISEKTTREEPVIEWNGFKGGLWQREINVRDFIQQNYTSYEEDDSFLAPATQRTRDLWNKLKELFA